MKEIYQIQSVLHSFERNFCLQIKKSCRQARFNLRVKRSFETRSVLERFTETELEASTKYANGNPVSRVKASTTNISRLPLSLRVEFEAHRNFPCAIVYFYILSKYAQHSSVKRLLPCVYSKLSDLSTNENFG